MSEPEAAKGSSREVLWTCAMGLLCLIGVTLADPPDYAASFPGTYGCTMYQRKDVTGSNVFTNPTDCVTWGSTAATSGGTACEGILSSTAPSVSSTDPNVKTCPSTRVSVNSNYIMTFYLSFNEFFNLTNVNSSMTSAERIVEGHVSMNNSTGKFTSTTTTAPGSSYFKTTNTSTGESSWYLLADNDTGSSALPAMDGNAGCFSTDLRQFSVQQVVTFRGPLVSAGLDTYFLHCVKTSNDPTTSDPKRAGAGGCFLSR